MKFCSKILALFLLNFLAGCNSSSEKVATVPNSDTDGTVDPIGIIISEASSSNSIFTDLQGDTPDWFEIYNRTSSEINLSNWSVTDDSGELDKWKFPEVLIAPEGYLRIWASKKDFIDEEDNLHTNFKLSSDGETLILVSPEGKEDRLEVFGLSRNVSIGRSLLDGALVYYSSPTPGLANTAQEYDGLVSSKVLFSHDGGEVYQQEVEIDGTQDDEVIRYTLDASVPTENSIRYTTPITVDSNTVIRARIFRDNFIPSPTESRTYITSDFHDLPIVTLVTEPSNLFDPLTGIYAFGPSENYSNNHPYHGANFWQDWERDIHFSFYEENGELGVAIDAGIKIFGGESRAHPQRSLSIFARGRYGYSELKYPLFPALEYDTFQSIVLRNTGNDWMYGNMRDVLSTRLMRDSGLEFQESRAAVVYINGEYWGYYNIREKISEHFLDDKINVSKSEINLLELEGTAIEGSAESYKTLVDFIIENSLSDQDNFNYVATQVDIDNFIKYQVAQIFFDNRDWPGNNIKFWNSPETKWRWILYDTDQGWGLGYPSAYLHNTLTYALSESGLTPHNQPWSTLLLRRLIDNDGFRNKLLNQFADEFNERFSPSNTLNLIASHISDIQSEMQKHVDRWSNDNPPGPWVNSVSVIENFAENRIHSLRIHILNYFNLSGIFDLNVEVNEESRGRISVNSLLLSQKQWEGSYFNSVPITLTAMPNDGFRFSHWEGDIEAETSEIQIVSTDDIFVKAIFIQLD